MKTYWGSGGIAPLILWPRHYMEVSGQLQAPAALPTGEEPLVPIRREAGWAPEPFWTRWWTEMFPYNKIKEDLSIFRFIEVFLLEQVLTPREKCGAVNAPCIYSPRRKRQIQATYVH
jgi:hypothetical protein